MSAAPTKSRGGVIAIAIAAGVVAVIATCGIGGWFWFRAVKNVVAESGPPPTPPSPPVTQMPSTPSVLFVVPSSGSPVAPELDHGLYWLDSTTGAATRWTANDAALAPCRFASVAVHAGGVDVTCNEMLVSYTAAGTATVTAATPPQPRSASRMPQPALTADGHLAWGVDESEPSTCAHHLDVYSPGAAAPTPVPDTLGITGAYAWPADASGLLFGSACTFVAGCIDPYSPPPPPAGGEHDCLRRVSPTDGTLTELWRSDGHGMIQSIFVSPSSDHAIVFVGHAYGPALYSVDLVHHTAQLVEPIMPPHDIYASARKHWLDAAWSPDGRSIAFLSDDETECYGPMNELHCDVAVYVMSPDGSSRHRLGHAVAPVGFIAWGP